MTEEDAFLLDVLANPEDDAARLVYADWLLDRDDPRADLVRQAYLLRSVRASDPAHADFGQEFARARLQHGWQEYDGLLLTWEQVVTVFRFRLAEVVAHCSGDLTPMRSWELEPNTLVGRGSGGWPAATDPVWQPMLLELAVARRQRLARLGRLPSRLPTHLSGGKLVLFDPAIHPWDRETHNQSKGFFDFWNAPPWDSWVMYLDAPPAPENLTEGERYLLAWVPPGWLYFAGVGLSHVVPQGSLRWAHESSTPFLRRLRQAGLSGV